MKILKQGLKFLSDDNNQVAIFPSQDLNITQGANAPYSHLGTKNTDNASAYGRKRLYAPCDMKVVSSSLGGYGVVIYHTIEPVYTARHGLTHFTMVLMHDDNSSRWTEGSVIRQGDHIYDEGTADPSGLTTGVHVHYELSLGHKTERIITMAGGRYHIKDPVYIDDIFFIDYTNIVKTNAVGSDKGEKTFIWKLWYGGGGGVIPDPRQQKETFALDSRYMGIGGVKMGDIFKVVSNDGETIVLKKEVGAIVKPTESVIGKVAQLRGKVNLYDEHGKQYPEPSGRNRDRRILDAKGHLVQIEDIAFTPQKVWVKKTDIKIV